MATPSQSPCKPFYFTGEPNTAENATNWLSIIEANVCSSMTNREKLDLFSRWLQRASPARKWFNKLPDEGHRRWHLVCEAFKLKWCKTTDTPALIALLATDTILPQMPDVNNPDNPSPTPQLSLPKPDSIPEINTTPTFTISYTPLLHPEPSATRSGTNAIQVTQFELSKILQRAFQQGLEHAQHRHQLDLADAIKELNAQYEDRLLEASNEFADRAQESSDNAFEEGFSAGIREEQGRWESAQASKVNVNTQTDPTITPSTSVQPKPPITPPPSTATISTQTEPLLPTISQSPELPVPISDTPIPATPLAPFNWADDAASISTIPTIPPKMPRDLSSLRSSSKNPFSSLRRRYHHPKSQKAFSSHRYTQSYPTHRPIQHIPPLHTHPLDWHRDPRLFELSRVLRTLGWSHP